MLNRKLFQSGGGSKAFGYDGWQALATNVVCDPAQNLLMLRGYSRNLAGNILGQNTEQGEYAYGYDLIDQLTNVLVSGYSGPSGAATNESFAYDPMGNRFWSSSTVNAEPGTVNYSANNLNQYSSMISFTNDASRITNDVSYDLNGNMVKQWTDTKTNEYTWDIENRLVSLLTSDLGSLTSVSYTYDPFGRRIMKSVADLSNTSNPSYTTNYFLYSDEGLIGEFDSFGSNICSYGYAPDSLWMNNSVWMRRDGEYYYFANDHLGAPQKMVAKNGSVVWSLVQDAFGNAVVSTNSTVTCNLRFSSQYYDDESGLQYNTMRYYDPVSGRYLSRDPIEEEGGWNLYGFAMNRPINNIDLNGLKSLKDTMKYLEGNFNLIKQYSDGDCSVLKAILAFIYVEQRRQGMFDAVVDSTGEEMYIEFGFKGNSYGPSQIKPSFAERYIKQIVGESD